MVFKQFLSVQNVAGLSFRVLFFFFPFVYKKLSETDSMHACMEFVRGGRMRFPIGLTI